MRNTITTPGTPLSPFYPTEVDESRNQLIHVICVPAILWSLMVWLAMTGPLGRVDASFGLLAMPFYLNGALLLAAIYALLYLALEPYASVRNHIF